MPEPLTPPQASKSDGSPRTIGVELEFGGLTCAHAAAVVARQLGGTVREIDRYRFVVDGTALGAIRVELDTQFVHPGETTDPEQRVALERERMGDLLEGALRTAIGEVTALYLPVELVVPPVPVASLPELDALLPALREAGARDTGASPIYGFGLQLNIDPPDLDPATLQALMRAYAISGAHLRREIGVDWTRRLLPFVEPWPRAYLRALLAEETAPALSALIDTYLTHNATRNRDLDLLPLFLWLDPSRVRAAVSDPRLQPRPAMHYRLPDSRLEDPAWSVTGEWNRWVTHVERLAADSERLRAAGADYLDRLRGDRLSDWADQVAAWLGL
ncbi:Putative amidoligase enzyme [Limimonas halophila]|uniref:Putative amidoligase enzyme n=1 Tax=Limimonas halophila TaxID=1082479 RepID=A0A1G7T1H9_9PROT|nr:amidoligase family protein [Limimonas halophila]SDG29206.1 Putative amidoligase enzyme [Limimonas halophila]